MTLLEPDATGRRRRFRAWIFTPVLSRYRYAHACLRETTESAIEACEAAWRFFGGVFRVVIPDNTKVIVAKADPLAPLITAAFLEYAQTRGFEIDTTRVRKPKDKARVERSVPDVREDCFRGEQLLTLADAVRRGEDWSRNEYGMRRHTRTQRLPQEHLTQVEQPCLLPAPAEPYDVPHWCDPKVGPDQLAVVCKAIYSIPRLYRGKKLRARADSRLVRFYYKRELIETAPRQPPGGKHINAVHYPADRIACAQRETAFIRNKAVERGPAIGRYAEVLLAVPLPWTRMRRVYALLGLCRRYGDSRVEAACEQALTADMLDVRRLDRMLQLAASTEGSSSVNRGGGRVIPLARYLRPSSQYALSFSSKDGPTQQGDKQ